MRQSVGEVMFRNKLQAKICCYRLMGNLISIASAGLFVYGIVLNFNTPLTSVQSTLIQLYLISQIFMRGKMVACLILIAILPLITILAVVYKCCKRQKKADLPHKVEMSRQMLSKCSECSICFMSFQEGEAVLPLKCSDMHIFHQTCIKGWTRIKPTCPICRADLT